MSKKNKLRKGMAHREYIAVIKDIKRLFEEGYDLKAIHQYLTDDGKITMSYQALWENINRGKKKVKHIATAPSIQTVTIPPAQTGVTDAASQEQRRKEFQAAMRHDIAEAEKQLTASPELDKSEHDKLSEKLI